MENDKFYGVIINNESKIEKYGMLVYIGIESIQEIETNIGKNIHITETNKQGKKIKEYSGEILESYNSLFLVKINSGSYKLNKTFPYVDFITNEMSFEIV